MLIRDFCKKNGGALRISSNHTIAVAYLARGADKDSSTSFERFIDSYRRNSAGIDHAFYVIFKGFKCIKEIKEAKALFRRFSYTPVFLDDSSLDIGAYIEWANMVKEDYICSLNTSSEILSPNWLCKLYRNINRPKVGLVGATGSNDSLSELNSVFPKFPNIHIRTTGFMIDRRLFCSITNGVKISCKFDSYYFESGPKSLTRKIMAIEKKILVVGRNGRGYSPKYWSVSDTYRQGAQRNLLIADNQTRDFLAHTWSEKRKFANMTWGKYLHKLVR